MKQFAKLLLISLLSFSAYAESTYNCQTKNEDNIPYSIKHMELNVKSTDSVELYLDDQQLPHGSDTPSYARDLKYKPRAEGMKPFSKFSVKEYNRSCYSDGPITPLYVENQLLTGTSNNGRVRLFTNIWVDYHCTKQ